MSEKTMAADNPIRRAILTPEPLGDEEAGTPHIIYRTRAQRMLRLGGGRISTLFKGAVGVACGVPAALAEKAQIAGPELAFLAADLTKVMDGHCRAAQIAAVAGMVVVTWYAGYVGQTRVGAGGPDRFCDPRPHAGPARRVPV